MKAINFNKETGVFIRQEKIQIGNTADAAKIKTSLKTELAGIVRQVKNLKSRAEEIKSILVALDESIAPVPEAGESQSLPVG